MGKRNISIYLSVLFLVIQTACEETTDYYLGINQQPKFVEGSFEEGINLFGLLRPGSRAGFNRSFVYMQEITPALSEGLYTFLTGSKVQVIDFSNSSSPDTILFPMMPPDSLFGDTLYRPLGAFMPKPGVRYKLSCLHEGLPEAIGEACFPYPPTISEGSFSISGNRVGFSVLPDTLIRLIDVYFQSGDKHGFLGRFVPAGLTETNISVNLPGGLVSPNIIVYGYDANLANYYANSNISLNFNKYRTTISTLKSGFGVFGALNYTILHSD